MCSICHSLYVSETRCLRPKVQFQEMSVLSKNLFKRVTPQVKFQKSLNSSKEKYTKVLKKCQNVWRSSDLNIWEHWLPPSFSPMGWLSLHSWPPFSHVTTSCWAEWTQWPELPKIIKKMKTLSFAQRPYKRLLWRWRNKLITRQTWKNCEINRILSKIIENCLRKFEDIKKIPWQSLP